MPASAAKPLQGTRALIRRLDKRGTDLARIAMQVERTPQLVDSVIAAIGADSACAKFAASKLLRILSQTAPALVYPHFDSLTKLLSCDNSILKWNAMLTVANLAPVDEEKKIDGILDLYFSPICGSVMVDAANTIKGAAVIAVAKPQLAERIAMEILKVERATYATRECRNVAIGHAIVALDQLFPAVEDKELIRSFAARQIRNPRPATRTKALKFCKKWAAKPGD